jgi:hypothetical protein
MVRRISAGRVRRGISKLMLWISSCGDDGLVSRAGRSMYIEKVQHGKATLV